MSETDKRLVLRYEPGQFSFRHIRHDAPDSDYMELAEALNEFQTEPPKRVLLVTTIQF